MSKYPRQLEIKPLTKSPHAIVRVPGSKSITNRALVLAALTASDQREIILDGALQSEDTEVMIESLGRLGFVVVPDWNTSQIRVRTTSRERIVPASKADLFVANSGTSMRFLTALVSLGHGRYRLDGVPRMRERPIDDLLDALKQLGVNAFSENCDGCPPVVVESQGLRGGTVRIKGGTSSQFISALLMAAPFGQDDLTIEVAGQLVSIPYVTMTVAMMQEFCLMATEDRPGHFVVLTMKPSAPLLHYHVQPDASAASYFFGAAAIMGGSITVTGLRSPLAPVRDKAFPIPCLQGDVRFVDVLERMGCRIDREADSITVHGDMLHGIDVDMNDISDTVMTLGAVACFAAGPTTIRNVAHIRHKETDRLAALAAELRRVGAGVHEFDDGLTITPAPLHGAVIETYNDHRMAMSMALVGLKIPGIVIDHPACVAKTYPRFFDDLERLR